MRLKLVVLSLIMTSCFSAQTVSPTFEGEVIYANTYKSKNPKVTDKQLTAMLGSVHYYYVKGGDYKTVTNAMFAQWQLYINKDNKIYNKMASSDTLFYVDGMDFSDDVISTKVNKNVATVLGYPCDEVILNCTSGVQKYYFSTKFRIDSKLFTRHKYASYYNYISLANAVPLKMILEDKELIIETVATKIESKKIAPSLFILPPNSKTAPSQY